MTYRRRLVGPLFLALAITGPASAWAADPAFEQAKTLYASASFEDALAAIGRVGTTETAAPEVLLYKALCLLALGRPQEAATATRSLVNASPTFAPDTNDLPPRFQTLWADTRKATLPVVTRTMFSMARTRFQAKEYIPALEQFEQVLALTNDPAWKDTADATDLRTLASGFIDLSQAALPKVEPGPPLPAVALAASAPAPARIEPILVASAVAIRQELPRWSPPDPAVARMTFDGAVHLSIDAQGRVTEAVMAKPTHRAYDSQLLKAARGWTYKPATRNGVPIASEKVVEIHLVGTNP